MRRESALEIERGPGGGGVSFHDRKQMRAQNRTVRGGGKKRRTRRHADCLSMADCWRKERDPNKLPAHILPGAARKGETEFIPGLERHQSGSWHEALRASSDKIERADSIHSILLYYVCGGGYLTKTREKIRYSIRYFRKIFEPASTKTRKTVFVCSNFERESHLAP